MPAFPWPGDDSALDPCQKPADRVTHFWTPPMLARRATSQLLIVDIQDRLAPAIADAERVITNTARLVAYATRLGVPITVTEHHPAGLGRTVALLDGILSADAMRCQKETFSAWQEAGLRERVGDLARSGRRQVVICGMETHVCVLQTALDLLANGLEVLIVAEATGSRHPEMRQLALDRIARAGGVAVSHEMIAFEWLERGGTQEFKDLLPVLK
jgi:nicotinamidase-related amidase